ncbi:unnamed protein product [Nesidiocoris tenuis]|uniref:MGA conserved domain-containing protein n=1 Tax=Nesidiocoris tenuis TaxID=355587 RepID=A0A6H5H8S1_9HEMI|nr:unnamed protein product [Nesidiocoris tenuis]
MADVDIIGEVPTSSTLLIDVDSVTTLESASSTSDLLEFKCNDIEKFLNFFQPKPDVVAKMESDACAIPPETSSSLPLSPSTDDSLSSAPSHPNVASIKDEPNLTPVIREFELPKSIMVFNRKIYTTCTQNRKNFEVFNGKPKIGLKEVEESRFPPELISCYGEDVPPATPVGSATGNGPDSTELEADSKADAPLVLPKNRRKRRKQRFSLLEVKKFHYENGKERELLLPDENDLKTALSKVLPGRDIPFVYQCKASEEHNCTVKCARSANNFKLYMSVCPNNGIPPLPTARENLQSKICQGLNVVDKTTALIATTALRVKNQPNYRIFVPVSDDVVRRIPVARDLQIGPLFDVKLEIDDAVRSVVGEMVEFVDRQSNVLEPDYDPDVHETSSFESSINDDSTNLDISDGPCKTSTPETSSRRTNRRLGKTDRVIRELKKLANISVADESSADVFESVKKTGNCTELFCKLGCVCDSLKIKPPPPDHCGNSDCIFGCICGERQRFVYVPIEELAKNEKSWHQTVIRKADNCVEIQSGIARSKRTTKAPERFDDWTPGPGRGSRKMRKAGEEKKPGTTMKSQKIADVSKKLRPQNKNPSTKQDVLSGQNKVGKLLEMMKDKRELGETPELDERTIKKLSLSKKLVYCRTAGKSAKSLADVFIYCSIHNVYDCECDGWIVMMKNGDMLLKSAFKQTKLMEDALKTISLSNPTTFRKKAMVYDLARHSARTADPVIDYVKRNRCRVFRKKTSIALEYGVPSYTNSYVKVPPVPLVSYCEDEVRDTNPSFLGTGAVDSGVGRVVKLSSKGNSENEKCRVVDDQTGRISSPAPTADLLPEDDFESEEVAGGKFTIVEPPQKRPRAGHKIVNKKSSSAPRSKPAESKSVHQNKINDSTVVIDLSRVDSPVERQPVSSIVISDDDEEDERLPDFGLFCQSHPHLGYVGLEDRGDGFFGVRGFSERIDKLSFLEIKQACEFLKQLLDHTGDPKYANSKWVKVTKGVLELKRCQRFVPSRFLRSEHDAPPVKKKTLSA